MSIGVPTDDIHEQGVKSRRYIKMNLRPVNKPQDENGKEKYSENEPKRTRTVSTEVLDTFWNLTEVVDETRIESAVTLLDLLKKVSS